MVRDLSCGAKCAPRITSKAVQNLVRGFGPNEGPGILVVNCDVLADGCFQFFDAAENAPANALVGKFGKPALHQVDPRTVGGSEVEMEARPFGEPFSDQGCLVRPVVIQDDMDLQCSGHLRLDQVEELAKLQRTMASV